MVRLPARGLARGFWAPLVLLLLVCLLTTAPAIVEGATRDTAFYPVSSRSPAPSAPPLLFEKIFETAVPGIPSADPLRAATEAHSVTVRTTAGDFLVDGASGTVRQEDTPLAPASSGPTLCSWSAGSPPRWLTRLRSASRPGACVEGPEGMIGILSRDGTVYVRDGRRGHLLWRRIAAGRISRPGAAIGPYLFIAADASRTLEASRWADGSTAGLFRLDSEDAYFASTPVVEGGILYVLAVQSPRMETRILALRPRSAIIASRTAALDRPPAAP